MPDNNTQTTANPTPVPTPAPVSDSSAPAIPSEPVNPTPEEQIPGGPIADALEAAAAKNEAPEEEGVIADVAGKIANSQNILIALSSDPSVDEISAAIGLSLYLDKLGKRATAIYSGTTPNALEFLKPEETFESTADALQDFVIALNKEKADHLRYKLDGDYVKIYITPYKSRISSDDLEFSYGDFNIDLVLALDVANGIDLDSALREHGRIMHDAVIVNITTGKPGKLGEIEWSDKSASSVSEMAAKLLYGIKADVSIEKDEATAFLTGIVAATNRFSSANTTPETMKIASQLMESGANQQLIAKNITPEVENEIMSYATISSKKPSEPKDPTKLDIAHEGEEQEEIPEEPGEEIAESKDTEPEIDDDLKAAEASLAEAGAETTPVETQAPIRIEDDSAPVENPEPIEAAEPVMPEPIAPEPATTELPPVSLPAVELPEPVASSEGLEIGNPEERAPIITEEKIINPSEELTDDIESGEENKYGRMLEDALDNSGAPIDTSTPIVNPPEDTEALPQPVIDPGTNIAAAMAPPVPSAPEINGVPEINYMPLPSDGTLPPPPTPPVDFSATAPVPAPMPEMAPAPEVPSPISMGGQAAMQDQVYNQQAANPGAFQIPGM